MIFLRISIVDYLAYLIDRASPRVDQPPPPPQNPSRVDSILSYLDEANHNEVIIESVRSQKSSTPTSVRFAPPSPLPPPPSSTRQQQHQQQSKKLAQSVSVTQIRASPSLDQQSKHGTKVTTPHKSLMVATQPTKPLTDEMEDYDEDQNEATRTAHDVTETVLQLRMDNEEQQRQIIIIQQRLVSSID